jgi:hypothetical protein
MTEAIVSELAEFLDSFGERIKWIHVPDSRQLWGTRGSPDYLIVGRRGVLWRECKPRPSSRLSPAQVGWKYMLLASGQDFKVWTARDLADGTCEHEVEAIV